MIGILIISHSASIARGVKELAEQMAKGQVAIAAAGGTLEGDLGTSADTISAAIESLGPVDEILALVDMGSAVMSAEMALELSGKQFRMSAAPLVEGGLVAAIEATRPGATLIEIAAAAERALETKGVAPVSAAPAQVAPTAVAPATPSALEATLTITNKVGLHMRPANLFVQTAGKFQSSIRAQNLDRPERASGDAKRMLDVMKLGVAPGHRLLVRAEGDDAQQALEALTQLVAENFGEE